MQTEGKCTCTCAYTTSSKRIMNEHTEAKHEGVRYGCDQCDYKAMRQGYLKTHKEYKHEAESLKAVAAAASGRGTFCTSGEHFGPKFTQLG